MLIKPEKSKKKTILLVLVLILVVGAMIYILGNFYSQQQETGKSKETTPKVAGSLSAIQPLEIDLVADFLVKEPYIKLEPHGQLPVKAGRIGRENPFLKLLYNLKAE